MKAPTMSIRAVTVGLALVAAAACSDKAKRASVDSSLARDLALAGSQPAQPTFQDTAIAPTPSPEPAAPTRREQPAPVRTRTAQKPITQTPRPVAQAPANQPAPAPVVTQPAPVQGPAPAPARAEIGAGTGFALTSGSKICSTSLPGDKFVATLNSPVTGTNGAAIPAGATAVIEVASVSGTDTDNPQLAFRIRAIVVGDKTYDVAASVTPEASLVKSKVANADPNADKKKVIGGAIAGAILGQMVGHNTKGTVIGAAAGAAAGAAVAKSGEKYEACLPAGSPLRVTLNAPLVIS